MGDFNWASFKWTTQRKAGQDVVETQNLKCSISLKLNENKVPTGYKAEGSIDCLGGDIEHFRYFGGTIDDCVKLCEQDNNCNAVGFITKGAVGTVHQNGKTCMKKRHCNNP